MGYILPSRVSILHLDIQCPLLSASAVVAALVLTIYYAFLEFGQP